MTETERLQVVIRGQQQRIRLLREAVLFVWNAGSCELLYDDGSLYVDVHGYPIPIPGHLQPPIRGVLEDQP